ncbi:hypothetical protein EV356DRAFT_508099 [Viridothelium virens]|uniref:Uncharacterized protein n=1 Tax=Viridothelium virens TaxID=1048519 RepID=A0A6A6GYD3_VIRVR|nr:hypothetical protein EV356DRAFT_508099 [Viridothelium virens]
MRHSVFSASFRKSIVRYETFIALGLSHTCCPALPLFRESDIKIHEIQDENSGPLMDLEALMTEFETELTETSTTLVSFLQNTWSKRMMKYFEEPSDNIVAQTYIGDVEVCLSQDEEYYKAGQERIRLWSEGFEEVDGMDSNCNSTNFICHTP